MSGILGEITTAVQNSNSMAQTAGPCPHHRGFHSALAIATEIPGQVIPGEVGDKTSPRISLFSTRLFRKDIDTFHDQANIPDCVVEVF